MNLVINFPLAIRMGRSDVTPFYSTWFSDQDKSLSSSSATTTTTSSTSTIVTTIATTTSNPSTATSTYPSTSTPFVASTRATVPDAATTTTITTTTITVPPTTRAATTQPPVVVPFSRTQVKERTEGPSGEEGTCPARLLLSSDCNSCSLCVAVLRPATAVLCRVHCCILIFSAISLHFVDDLFPFSSLCASSAVAGASL